MQTLLIGVIAILAISFVGLAWSSRQEKRHYEVRIAELGAERDFLKDVYYWLRVETGDHPEAGRIKSQYGPPAEPPQREDY